MERRLLGRLIVSSERSLLRRLIVSSERRLLGRLIVSSERRLLGKEPGRPYLVDRHLVNVVIVSRAASVSMLIESRSSPGKRSAPG